MPLIGGWRRRRTAKELVQDGSPDAIQLLAEAVADSRDEQVRDIALDRIRCLDTQPHIDAVCAVWAETRHPTLAALLIERGWVASAPGIVKALSALKTNQLECVTEGDASVVQPLVQACKDADPDIARLARLVLGQLKKASAKEALCRLFIERGDPIAREIALASDYLPRDEYQRALFFFLTEQWERYEALDFDRRLLRTVYDSANTPLRQRIMEKLRAAGRTDFLTVVAGRDYRSRAAEITPVEADFLVQMLARNSEWAKVWALVFDLPLNWSARAVRILYENGWMPEAESERATFGELVSLATDDLVAPGQEGNYLLPLAILRARARVPGRINEVAFSPVGPVIAIGTGQRKVGLWNFEHAEMETVLRGFEHSIGEIIFTPDGTLLCAERTNTYSPCAIHAWRDGQRFRIGQHDASVTAVEPAGHSLAFSTGRDHRVTLWDLEARRKVREAIFGDWARAARVSLDRQQAAILHRGAMLVSLPQLEVVAERAAGRSVSNCVAFAPEGETLIVGKLNGKVFVYERKGQRLRQEAVPLARHGRRAQDVEVLPNSPVVITAGSDGLVQFTSWTRRDVLGSVRVPGERLMSLKISPDGAFMAIGDSDASMSLWDLRVMSFFMDPLAQATPAHLSLAKSLVKDVDLDAPVQHALKFAECVLRHRFRYEIEIGEAPTIKAGEFDIEIE